MFSRCGERSHQSNITSFCISQRRLSATSIPRMQENEWSMHEDWDLAEAAGGGDEDAFAALTARHQNTMHRFIFRSIGQEETARDLTQEVFVRAWFALPKVSQKAKFTTWLFQIAVNLCRDHARSKS